MKILIILLLVVNIFAEEVKTYTYGYLKNTTIWMEGTNPVEENKEKYNSTNFELVSRIEYKNLLADIDIEAYTHSTETDSFKNKSIGYEKKNDIQINSALLSYKANSFGIYTGVIPFRGGRFSRIKSPNRNGGNGIELLTDQVLVGVFASYQYDCFKIISGYAEWRKELNYNSLIYDSDGSKGIFNIITFAEDNHFLEIDYYHVDAVHNAEEDAMEYMELDLFGVGYIYDDTLESGFLFSLEMGYVRSKENVEDFATLSSGGIPLPYIQAAGYNVTDSKNSGHSFKYNLKYEDEIFSKDYFVGFEHFRTYDNWVSMNHGTTFLSNNSWWFNRDTSQYTVYSGLYLSNNLLLQAKYSQSEIDKVPDYFSAVQNISYSQSPMQDHFYTKVTQFQIEISYKF